MPCMREPRFLIYQFAIHDSGLVAKEGVAVSGLGIRYCFPGVGTVCLSSIFEDIDNAGHGDPREEGKARFARVKLGSSSWPFMLCLAVVRHVFNLVFHSVSSLGVGWLRLLRPDIISRKRDGSVMTAFMVIGFACFDCLNRPASSPSFVVAFRRTVSSRHCIRFI